MGLTITLHPELTAKQRAIIQSRSDFLILKGPAGTCKTYTALAKGLKLRSQDRIEKIVIIRSAVETRPIGFLPGDSGEKMDVYKTPYTDLVSQLSPKRNFNALVASKELEFHPTSYLRGVTFDDSFVIVDEYQNMSAHELETIVTRVGENTHLVLCGDSDQTDLIGSEGKDHLKIINVLERMPDFQVFEFTEDEILRSAFVRRYYQAKKGLYTSLPAFVQTPADEDRVRSYQ